ncbi:hypothetical protein BKP37_17115 [Anaerobacillus alkalilacustris]|uniref:histidine kinase n=2 Tax=Anaerobacillus alkalilacustris TaxID=393763 RepID=A0A1S2LFQ0_9BACI|nr:hypothetical protein BKP37_17115 [Anaerobacillus alkalilacustris]
MMITATVVLYLFFTNLYPYIGIRLTLESDHFYVQTINKIGWGAQSDIQVGDQIILINHLPPEKHMTVKKFLRIEQAETITVLKGTNPKTFLINHTLELTRQYLYHVVIPFLYFLFNILVSIFLVKNRIPKNSSILLIYFFMLLSLCFISGSSSARLNIVGVVTVNFSFLVAPVLFLHFFYQYLVENGKLWIEKRLLFWLYIMSFLTFFIVTLNKLMLMDFFINAKLVLFSTFLFLISIVAITLLKCYRLSKKDEIREPIRWMLLTFALSLAPYIFLYTIPFIIFGEVIMLREVASLFIFFIPTIIFYLLLVNKLFPIKVYVNQIEYYLAILIIPSTVVTFIIKAYYSNGYTLITITRTFLVIYVLLFLFLVLKNYIDRKLRAVLFVESEQYQKSIYRYSEAIKRENKVSGVLNSIEREMKEVLKVKFISYIQVSKKGNFICADTENQFLEGALAKKINSQVLNVGKIIEHKEYFLLVIGERQNYYYCLIVKKLTNTPIRKEQQDWLEVLAYYTSISIENMIKIEDLLKKLESVEADQMVANKSNWLNRLMVNWSEKERKHLATDIHDTILQDLIVHKRKVEEIKRLAKDKPLILESRIEELEEDVLDMMYTIRETCHELSPPLLAKLGLKHALQDLEVKFNLLSTSKLVFKIEGDNQSLQLKNDYELAVFRSVQELLNNAIKHAKATEVTILVKINDQTLEIYYQDNGIGTDLSTQNKDRKNMGLSRYERSCSKLRRRN